MAEEFGDKTEAPTPKRRMEARERGQIARSQDLTAGVLLVTLLVLMQIFGPGLVSAIRVMLASLMSGESLGNFSSGDLGEAVSRQLLQVGLAALPLFAGALVAAVLANVLQVGFHFSPKRLAPNLGALNPLRGLGKIFHGPNIFHLGMNIIKMTIIALVAYSAIHDRLGRIVTSQQLTFIQGFGLGAQIVYDIALRIGIIIIILAILDYAYQRYRIEKELKMTKQEVKDEMRSMEGDPRLKSRRRQIAIQLIQQRLKKDVPTADVVVTNPTEFAVAMKYDPAMMHAPKVVAKGRGHVARRIREIAIASGVPIIERKPLARALFKLCAVGQEIPEQFYSAVAEILAYVYELTGKLRRAGAAGLAAQR